MHGRDVLASAMLLVLIAGLTMVCRNPSGPDADCSGGLSFTALPVPISAISAATPVGNLGAPTHTIPTDHTGVYLNGTGITLSSPAPLRITVVKTTQYLMSPFRQSQSDFAITAAACANHQVLFGHIQTVVEKIQNQIGNNCQTYSTATETVKSCTNDHADISLTAGETIGTVGGATAGAFDFGLYQTGHSNGFVNPSRFSSMTNTAVCPYDPFTMDLRNQIYALIGEPGRPASGESPVCGTMNVDVAGTARGVWVLQSNPVNQMGDETPFAVLAPHPLYPQSGQTFSIGPPSIAGPDGAPPIKYPVNGSGRVNRAFKDVGADSQIYCYVANTATSTFSYFIRLSGSVLSIRKLTHAAGATPCSADPSTWAMDGSAVNFIR